MDFDNAARRLQTDHAKLKASRHQKSRALQKLASDKATRKNQKLQEFRQAQLLAKKKREIIQKKVLEYGKSIVTHAEQKLGVTSVSGQDKHVGLELMAESIHGQGDKISLPPSVLSVLAEREIMSEIQARGQPLFFRLGIRREGYAFPAGKKMKEMMQKFEDNMGSEENENHAITPHDLMSDDDLSEDEWMEAYLEELDAEYVSYVYVTVIEFSQEEGQIGLPSGVASTLLHPRNNLSGKTIPSKLTMDPASQTTLNEATESCKKGTETCAGKESIEIKTPGHPAYGLFPVPLSPISVTLVANIPLGTKCTLQPTSTSIENGFYNLKNIKLALEQSLIRTRSCLNLMDVVSCWFRGKRFDLRVIDCVPSTINAISCINTDIEVDIAAVDVDKTYEKSESTTGQRLSDKKSLSPPIDDDDNDVDFAFNDRGDLELPPEPILSEKSSNIITIQIRGQHGKVTCKRRFDSSQTTIKHLFCFAASERILIGNMTSFHLIIRFPRRVLTLHTDGDILLKDVGLNEGREMLLVEES